MVSLLEVPGCCCVVLGPGGFAIASWALALAASRSHVAEVLRIHVCFWVYACSNGDLPFTWGLFYRKSREGCPEARSVKGQVENDIMKDVSIHVGPRRSRQGSLVVGFSFHLERSWAATRHERQRLHVCCAILR